MRGLVKLVISVSALLFAGAVLLTQTSGAYSPWLPLGFFITLGLIAASVYLTPKPSTVLVALLVLSASYRAFIFIDSPSLVGIDPHLYSLWIQSILETGYVDSESVTGFYAVGSAFIVYVASVATVLGISARYALVVFPLSIGIFAPLFAYLLADRAWGQGVRVPLLAAVIGAGAALSIRFAYLPIAQSLTGLCALAACYVLTRLQTLSRTRSFALLGVFGSTIMYSHKLGMVFLTFLLTYLSIILITTQWDRLPGRLSAVNTSQGASLVVGITAIAVTVTYLQLSTTGFIATTVYKILIPEVAAEHFSATAAAPAHPRLMNALFLNINIMILFGFGSVAWIVIFGSRPTYPQAVLLAIAAATVSIGAVGLAIGFGIRRAVAYAEPAFVAFLIVGLASIAHRLFSTPRYRRITMYALVFVVLGANLLVSPYAAPDDANYPRMYQQPAEQSVGSFAATYTPEGNVVQSDFLLLRSVQPSKDLENPQFEYWGTALLHGNYSGDRMLYRPHVDVYFVPLLGAPAVYVVPTHDPGSRLAVSHNRIFDSGGGHYYAK